MRLGTGSRFLWLTSRPCLAETFLTSSSYPWRGQITVTVMGVIRIISCNFVHVLKNLHLSRVFVFVIVMMIKVAMHSLSIMPESQTREWRKMRGKEYFRQRYFKTSVTRVRKSCGSPCGSRQRRQRHEGWEGG